jgi:hypothetical protein
MAATFISALVIKHNNDVFLTPELVVGKTMAIPTPGAGGSIDGDYWAVPISNMGLVSGFNFVPTTPDSVDAPTPQSFHVFRLINQTPLTHDIWYVRGSTTFDGDSPANPGYIQAAADAECCSEDPAELPTDVPALFPCQVACEQNADGNYFVVLGLPTDVGTYTGNGYINGETLPQITGANAGEIQTSLNNNWTNVGSPNVVITWSVTNNIAMGVITDGDGETVLCAKITSA